MDEADLEEPRHRAAGEAVEVRIGGALAAIRGKRGHRRVTAAAFACHFGRHEEHGLGDVQVRVLRR